VSDDVIHLRLYVDRTLPAMKQHTPDSPKADTFLGPCWWYSLTVEKIKFDNKHIYIAINKETV
jgi:hypothetical protein